MKLTAVRWRGAGRDLKTGARGAAFSCSQLPAPGQTLPVPCIAQHHKLFNTSMQLNSCCQGAQQFDALRRPRFKCAVQSAVRPAPAEARLDGWITQQRRRPFTRQASTAKGIGANAVPKAAFTQQCRRPCTRQAPRSRVPAARPRRPAACPAAAAAQCPAACAPAFCVEWYVQQVQVCAWGGGWVQSSGQPLCWLRHAASQGHTHSNNTNTHSYTHRHTPCWHQSSPWWPRPRRLACRLQRPAARLSACRLQTCVECDGVGLCGAAAQRCNTVTTCMFDSPPCDAAAALTVRQRTRHD